MSAVHIDDCVWSVGTAAEGPDFTSVHDCNCYLVWDGTDGLLIDSGTGIAADRWLANIGEVCDPRRLAGVVLTHYHADHAGGAARAAQAGLPLMASAETAVALESGDEEATQVARARQAGVYPPDYRLAPAYVDRVVTDGELVRAGRLSARVLAAPGHCAGNLTVLAEAGRRLLFSGDTVFTSGRVSVQPLPDCRPHEYGRTLLRLADETCDALFPGHGSTDVHEGQRHLEAAAAHVRALVVPPNYFHSTG